MKRKITKSVFGLIMACVFTLMQIGDIEAAEINKDDNLVLRESSDNNVTDSLLADTLSRYSKSNNADNRLWEKVKSETENATFPINLESKEWNELKTHEEMIQKCTIPEEILKTLTTKQLIDMVMNYPLLVDLYSYQSLDAGVCELVKNFNGLYELLMRKDLPAELLAYYKKICIPEKYCNLDSCNIKLNSTEDFDKTVGKIIDTPNEIKRIDKDFKTKCKIELIEYLILNEYMWKKYDTSYKKMVISEVERKENQKRNSELFMDDDGRSILKTNYLTGIDKVKLFSINIQKYVKTPNGSDVPVETFSYNGKDWANRLDAEFKKAYPKAKILRPSDNRYNCHSYAWYSTNTDNIYWMNSPQKYIQDGSYKKVTNKAKRGKGNRIIWFQYPLANPYVHSGYLASINSDGSYKIYSKWGKGPLMQHSAKYSPYSGTREYYKRS